MGQQPSSSEDNKVSVSEVDDEDKDKIMNILGNENSVLQSNEQNERKRKRQVFVFYYRKGKRPKIDQPTEDDEDEGDYEDENDEEINDEGEGGDGV
ncbi:unnamed protein product, partial [Pipistrellus nathusii]